MRRLDDAVTRIMSAKFALVLFENLFVKVDTVVVAIVVGERDFA